MSVTSRGRVGEGKREHDESPTSTTRGVAVAMSRSPVNTRSWGWGRRQDLAQPGTSPGNTLWPPLKESNPKVDAKCAAIVERGSGGTASSDASGEGSSDRGGRTEIRSGGGVLKSPGGSRSPPHSRVSPTTASLSGSSREHNTDGPSLSPLEAAGVGGSDSPPAMSLTSSIAVRSADRPIPYPTRGSRSLPWQAQDSPKTRGESGGARMPPIGSQPVKIERTSSDSSGGGPSRSTSGRRGTHRNLVSSAPREVPRKNAGRHASAITAVATAGASAHGHHGYGQGQGPGRGQGRMMTGLNWSRSGSNQDSPARRCHASTGNVGPVSGTGSSSTKRESGGGGRVRAATITSDSGGGGGGAQRSAGRSRVTEVNFNPFKKQDEKEVGGTGHECVIECKAREGGRKRETETPKRSREMISYLTEGRSLVFHH